MTFDEKYTDKSYIISSDNRAQIMLKEKKESRQYMGDNTTRKFVIVYCIDGGIVTQGKRCDFALYLRDEKVLYFIELKGSDYDKALYQLHTTITGTVVQPCITTKAVHARVVLSRVRVPNIKTSTEKKLEKLLKDLNGKLDKKSQVIKEVL